MQPLRILHSWWSILRIATGNTHLLVFYRPFISWQYRKGEEECGFGNLPSFFFLLWCQYGVFIVSEPIMFSSRWLFWLLTKRSLSCFACSYLASPVPPPALWYLCLCICTPLSATRYVRACYYFPGELQPAVLMRPSSISQCRRPRWRCSARMNYWKPCVVDGILHSFPQPRRHQQMVGVKTLNIKQPPFIIFFPQVHLLLQARFSAFLVFFFFT